MLSSLLIAVALNQVAPCTTFEPATVELSGKLVRSVFPGPPNYQDVKKGDAAEQGFYLHLEKPICASGGKWHEHGTVTSARVQLVLDEAGYDRLRPSLNRRVKLKGSLFPSLTGHHHAPLLLDVR
jgi:hypothetical protein